MARLQILELPEGSGDERPPFVLVIDQVPSDEAAFEAIRRDLLTNGDLAPQLGARAVLVFETTIDIPANDTTAYVEAGRWTMPDELRAQIHEEIGKAQTQLIDVLNRRVHR